MRSSVTTQVILFATLFTTICGVSYQTIDSNIHINDSAINDSEVSAFSDLSFTIRTQLNSSMQNPVELPSRWEVFVDKVFWPVAQTAVIIVDMWDAHWCDTEVRRGIQIAQGINHTITVLRNRGVQIIHSPAGCLDAYKTHPSYIRAQNFSQVVMPPIPPPSVKPYAPWWINAPYPLTFAPGSGGCDGIGNSSSTAWSNRI